MFSYCDFEDKYPNEDSCLEEVFLLRFGSIKYCNKCGAETKFYKVKKRKCYACKHCGFQIYPLVGTVFQKSHIPLKSWMFVIYLFSISKHGVSASEVQRHIGVSYKTAFRMCHLIRSLMAQPNTKLEGVVEADEAYLGGEMILLGDKRYWKNKSTILGAIERNGETRAALASGASSTTAIPFLRSKVLAGATLYTDDSPIYRKTTAHYYHDTVNHVRHQYAKGVVHTNTIEGFWSHLKRSIRGTYHGVSAKYLHLYLDEVVFRHNNRDKNNNTHKLIFNLAISPPYRS